MENKTEFNVWVIFDCCIKGKYSQNIQSVGSFDLESDAKKYVEFMEEIDEISRNNSRNPDWGYHYFIQIDNKKCYMKIDDCGNETPNIYSKKKDCKASLEEGESIKEIKPSFSEDSAFDEDVYLEQLPETEEMTKVLKKFYRWKKKHDIL